MGEHGVKRKPARSPILLMIFWAGMSALCLSGCGSDAPPEPAVFSSQQETETDQGIIVAVGDSLTAGLGVSEDEAYPAKLARKLKSDGYAFKVINAGVSGETSTGTLARIQWVISSLRPDIVILETGANDGLRGLDPTVLETNLHRIVEILKAGDIDVILAGMLMLPNLGPEYTRAFAEIYPRVASKHAIEFIPFFLEGVAGDTRYNQADRLHPTAQGYTLVVDHIYDQVVAAVDKHLKQAGQGPE